MLKHWQKNPPQSVKIHVEPDLVTQGIQKNLKKRGAVALFRYVFQKLAVPKVFLHFNVLIYIF